MKAIQHPGEKLWKELDKRGVSVASLATAMRVSDATIYNLLNGKGSVTVAIAAKLEALKIGKAATWLSMQNQFSLANIDKRKVKVNPKAIA